jgi:hypothetical protein
MTFSPGDLVLIPFPFSDLGTTKRRPVLALTSPDRHCDVIGLALTSVPQPRPHIQIDTAHFSKGKPPEDQLGSGRQGLYPRLPADDQGDRSAQPHDLRADPRCLLRACSATGWQR